MGSGLHISRVLVEGFKGYGEKQDVELSPFFNVVTGFSDHGKSAFIHAIRWVVRNQPLGVKFVNTESEHAYVEVHLSDGSVVTRSKTKSGGSSENSYVLVDGRGNESTFDAVGKEVPEEIRRAFRMDPLALQGKQLLDLNFGLQHDPLFLVFSSDSTLRSKILGVLTGAEVVDVSITILNRVVERIRSERIVIEKRKAEWEEKAKREADPAPLLEKLSEAKRLSRKLESARAKLDLIYRYEAATHDVRYEKSRMDAVTGVSARLSSLQRKLRTNESRLKAAGEAEEQLIAATQSIRVSENAYKASRMSLTLARTRLSKYVKNVAVCPYSHQPMPKRCRRALQKV